MTLPYGVGRRLSEKSIELNSCHQLSVALGGPKWWFGATQKQENDAGWDLSSRVSGAWVYFQLKASAHVLASGERKFMGHHDQLLALRALATSPDEVFYVFPTIGTTAELAAHGFNLIPNLRLLDVDSLPTTIDEPTTPSGSPRANRMHNFYLSCDTTEVTIRSEPITRSLQTAEILAPSLRERALLRRSETPNAESAERARAYLGGGRNRVAVFFPSSDL